LINEPLASGVIYPAVLAAWMFLAFAFPQLPSGPPQAPDPQSLKLQDVAQYRAILVFLVGFAVSFFYNLFLIKDDIRKAIVCLKTWRH